ncbi:MAG: site-specific integrase [Planctomycetes bacterium]|nr:site-specific integrase [Planctomycetota bacterium]
MPHKAPKNSSRHSKKSIDPSIPGEPSYRLHKRSGQAVVTLSRKDHYLGQYGTPESHERYRAAIAEWIARGRRPAEPEAAPLSVAELGLAYLDWAEGYYRDHEGRTNKAELGHIKRALKPLRELYGLTPAADFGPRKLGVIQQHLVADGLSRPTVNRYVTRIRHVFKWATAKELITAAVHQGLTCFENLKMGRTDAPEPEPVRAVPAALVDAIEPHVSRQIWGLIQTQRLTGMRPGEVVIMRARDIDTSGPLWQYRPAHHKTQHRGIERVIVLGPKAQAVVREFLKPDVSAYLFDPREAEAERRAAATAARKTDRRWGNKVGSNRKRNPKRGPLERYTPCSYARAVARACELAFLAPDDLTDTERAAWRKEHRWAPNQLRHTFATSVRRQFGLDAAQVALGHQQADVTQIYAERNLALAAEVALKIG